MRRAKLCGLLFSPPETPNSKWKLAVKDGATGITISLIHCDSAGTCVNIVYPVMVKMSILNGNDQKVFQQMKPSYSSRPYLLFELSKEEIVESDVRQDDGSLNFSCKIYAHKKKVLLSPAVDCSGVGLVDNLEQLFDKMNLSDVTFTIGCREFPAHKNILSARSEYFAGMFNHPTKENLSGQIEMEDIDPKVFEELLRFIYTGRLSPSAMERLAADLFIVADKYLVEGLKSQCLNYLVRNMSPASCVLLLLHGDLLHPAEYMKEAAKFIRRYPSEVGLMATDSWKTIKQEYPTLLLDIYEFLLKLYHNK